MRGWTCRLNSCPVALPTPERKNRCKSERGRSVGRASNACPDLATDYLKTRQQDTHREGGNGRVLFKSEPSSPPPSSMPFRYHFGSVNFALELRIAKTNPARVAWERKLDRLGSASVRVTRMTVKLRAIHRWRLRKYWGCDSLPPCQHLSIII